MVPLKGEYLYEKLWMLFERLKFGFFHVILLIAPNSLDAEIFQVGATVNFRENQRFDGVVFGQRHFEVRGAGVLQILDAIFIGEGKQRRGHAG